MSNIKPSEYKAKIDGALSDVEACISSCSDWEQRFIESIRAQFDDKGYLSDKQEEKLWSIWQKRT